MYNKLFTKILDSTIWLESDATRLVWITFIAAMDEDGFVALSSIGNVAARARVSTKAAEAAIRTLEAPDAVDPSQEYEGRRIERVPSGWMVLNSAKYRDIIKRAEAREHTRERVAKFRARNASVMPSNATKQKVTLSDTYSDAVSESKTNPLFDAFWKSYPRKDAKQPAFKAFVKLKLSNGDYDKILASLEAAKKSEQWTKDAGQFIPHAATWLNQHRWEDEPTHLDLGVCKYCERPAVKITNGTPHCATARHIDQAQGRS